MRITTPQGTPRSLFRYQTAAKVTTARPTIWSRITTIGLGIEAAGPPLLRVQELREREGHHDHGRDDPARVVFEEVVGDPDDGVVLDPDRSEVRGLGREDEDDPRPDEQPGERDDERRHAGLRDHERLGEADRRRARQRGHDRRPPGPPGVLRAQEERHHDAANGAHERHRQVDLPDQEHEDDADRDRRDRGHLQEEVGEVALGEERLVEEAEDDDDDHEADDDRQRPELAGANSLPPMVEVPRQRSLRGSFALEESRAGAAPLSQRRWDRHPGPDRSRLGHLRLLHPRDVPIVPAVIACTTSCCVVSDRSSTATR